MKNKINKKQKKINKMITYLEKKYKTEIKYNCEHCLEEAYQSEIKGITGYITDEELIEASNKKLKHK